MNTGESLFGLEEGFRPFIENRAVDIIHPDPLTSGAIRETKRIADYASMFGIPTAIHFAGSPVGCMAAVHMISTIKDFIVMENHAADIPWWDDLVTGVAKPIIQNGYIPVPNTPGIGVELNEEVVQAAPAHSGLLRADAAVRQVHCRRVPHRRPVPAPGRKRQAGQHPIVRNVQPQTQGASSNDSPHGTFCRGSSCSSYRDLRPWLDEPSQAMHRRPQRGQRRVEGLPGMDLEYSEYSEYTDSRWEPKMEIPDGEESDIIMPKSDLSRRRLLERAMGAAALGSAFKFVERPANGQPIQAGGVNRNSAPSAVEDHRHAGHSDRLQLRLPDHPH